MRRSHPLTGSRSHGHLRRLPAAALQKVKLSLRSSGLQGWVMTCETQQQSTLPIHPETFWFTPRLAQPSWSCITADRWCSLQRCQSPVLTFGEAAVLQPLPSLRSSPNRLTHVPMRCHLSCVEPAYISDSGPFPRHTWLLWRRSGKHCECTAGDAALF